MSPALCHPGGLHRDAAGLQTAPTVPPGVVLEEVTTESAHRLWARTLREIYGFRYRSRSFETTGWVTRWLADSAQPATLRRAATG